MPLIRITVAFQIGVHFSRSSGGGQPRSFDDFLTIKKDRIVYSFLCDRRAGNDVLNHTVKVTLPPTAVTETAYDFW